MSSGRLVILGAALVAVSLAVVVRSTGPSASAAFNDSDGDGVIDVAEQIGGSDPFDAASSPESTAGALYLQHPVCSDSIDNDRDGQIDGADPGCTDSDGDVVDDPSELVLGSDPDNFDSVPEDARVDAVLVSLGFITFQCNDGLDNDLDGLVDLDDPGCTPLDTDGDGYGDVEEKTYGSDPNSADSRPEDDRVDAALCADGADNDGDGLIDQADDGCLLHPTATSTSTPRTSPTEARSEATVTPPPSTTVPVAGLPAAGAGPAPPGPARAIVWIAGLAALAIAAAASTLAVRARRHGP